METKEGVNRNVRRRRYGARDKEELIKSIKKLHEEGYSQVDIAKMLDVSRGTILRWNKELHFINPRTPGEAGKLKSKIYNYDENYFANIDTPNKAYIVGYITGDGTIFDRHKSKTISSYSWPKKINNYFTILVREMNMVEAIKFRKKNKPNEQNKYSLAINSTKMCNDLIIFGSWTYDKTGHESWIDFHDEKLQWAYLRGFFDADGHIRVYQRNGYQKARMGFTGNANMLYSILSFFKSYGLAINVNSITSKQGCYDLYFSSIKDLKMIFQRLYQYGDIKLNRKYDKFSSLMI